MRAMQAKTLTKTLLFSLGLAATTTLTASVSSAQVKPEAAGALEADTVAETAEVTEAEMPSSEVLSTPSEEMTPAVDGLEAESMEPVGGVEMVEEPTSVDEIEATEPAAPVDEIEAVEPAAPVDEIEAVDPTAPVDEIEAVDPTAPVDEIEATDPTVPEDEVEATDPTAPAEDPTAVDTTTMTVVELAGSSEYFELLTAALEAADLSDVLSGEGPFTVFAPTDEAFEALPEGMLESLLLPENKDQLVQVLSYHVVPEAVLSQDLSAGEIVTSEGSEITVSLTDSLIQVNEANVLLADVEASNGIIHVIDQVILPPDIAASLPEEDAVSSVGDVAPEADEMVAD
ncbi:MAG: fasciclin domain-containing protein [Cyanobacteria bacterium P01_A01_bin.114]